MGSTRQVTRMTRAELEDCLTPRDDQLVRESDGTTSVPQPLGDHGEHRLGLGDGPFEHYERVVRWNSSTDDDDDSDVDRSDGGRGRAFAVEQTVGWTLGFPYWRWLYSPLFRRIATRRIPKGTQPWWLFPDRLSARQATVVATMALFNIVGGIIFGMLTQVMTFVSSDLGDGTAGQQTTVFAIVRIGTIATFIALALADRVGRRRIALVCFWISAVATLLTALSPTLAAFTVLQLLARNLAIAALLAVDTVCVEELPAGSRAMAVGLGTLAYGLGAGIAVLALPLADLGPAGWRLVFLVGLAAVPLIISGSRHLPESGRFAAMVADDRESHPRRIRGTRFALLAGMFLLINVFVAPASQLQNDYLRTERGFSGALITLLVLSTSTPAAIGVLAGGRLADTRSRRWTIIPGLVATAVFGAAFFAVGGAAMWLTALLASVLGALTIAPLGVLGPELFPTARRGGARGGLNAIAVIGSVIGLLGAGALSDQLGFGAAFALLAIGPVIAAVMALAVPETSGRELEDLNR